MTAGSVTHPRWLLFTAMLTASAWLSACGAATPDLFGGDEEEENEGFSTTEQGITCGTERWSVKTGTDADVSRVTTSSVTTTIATLAGYARPSSLPSNNRVSPVELTTYRLRNVTMTKYKAETDSDYHIVLSSGGVTMIVEIPNPGCAGSSRFLTSIQNTKAAFDAKYSATSTFKSSTDYVTVTGVGFWDYNHGQTGVATNAIELHPLLFFCSGYNC